MGAEQEKDRTSEAADCCLLGQILDFRSLSDKFLSELVGVGVGPLWDGPAP